MKGVQLGLLALQRNDPVGVEEFKHDLHRVGVLCVHADFHILVLRDVERHEQLFGPLLFGGLDQLAAVDGPGCQHSAVRVDGVVVVADEAQVAEELLLEELVEVVFEGRARLVGPG